MYHWAYIQQQVTSHHLRNNIQVNLLIGCCGAAQQTLLLPKVEKVRVREEELKIDNKKGGAVITV